MIQLAAYPTGRPVWVDPNRVSAVMDAMEMKPARIAGAEPTLTIIGTTIVVDGASLQLVGHAEDNAEKILASRLNTILLAN